MSGTRTVKESPWSSLTIEREVPCRRYGCATIRPVNSESLSISVNDDEIEDQIPTYLPHLTRYPARDLFPVYGCVELAQGSTFTRDPGLKLLVVEHFVDDFGIPYSKLRRKLRALLDPD